MYRILYVDDEASLLEIGKLYLERSGNFEVTTALSAPEGIRLLEQEKFDAIIADYQMPGMDGIQFLVEVRTRFGPIPFILFTGRGREEVVIQAINSGADFYLQKGGDPSAQFAELSHKIKSAASRKRAEDALVESEERYHEFFAVSRDSVFITSPEGRWIDFNDAILEMFGYGSRKEMFELPVPSIYANPDDRSAFIHLMERDGYVKEYPVQLKKKDGTVIDTLITAVLVRNPDGSLKAFIGAIRDVTAWKRAEEDAKKAHEELEASYEQLTATEEEMRQVIDDLSKSERAVRESEQVLSAIVMGSPIPQFVIDRNHRILHWNLALEEYSGISAKEVAGTTQQWRAFYPEERPCMADLLVDGEIEKIPQWYSGRFTKSKLISGAYEATDFFPKLGKTGTWLYFTAAPIRDTEGNIIGAVETLEDITERKRSEEALRESEEKYRNVVEDQTEFICRFLPDGTHIFVNDAYCRYFNRKREDVIGHRFRPRIPPEDRAIVARHIASITPEHPVIDIDHRIIMPDGSTRWQRWSDRAIFDPDGRVIEYQSVGRDISEQKEAERALLESETLLQAVVHGSPIPKFVIDKNHCIIYWNKALEEHSGIKAAEIVGTKQQWRAFYPHERPCMADLLVDGTIEKIPQWYEGKYSTSKFIEGAYEATDFFPKLGKTGTWLYFTAAPIRDTTGNIIGAVETLEDITERKWSEEALRESEEKYRNVVEDQTEFICRFLPDGTHIFVNDAYCRYFDRKREDVIGHRFRPRIPPEDREILERYIASITPEHPVIDIDQRIIMPDGGTRWQRWSDRAIFDPDGRVIEYQSVGRDITEYKRAEEELRQANRKLSLLSNFTRHDINNQLTGLVGYLSILEKKLPDPSFTSLFGKINATAERISAMIRFTEEYEKIGINAPAWQNCRTLLDAAAKETLLGQVMVKNDLPAGAEVFADPLIAKVCYNLMDNAARYGGKITTIRFSIEERDGDHVVVCEDDGDGVPAQEKEKIFERGYGKNTGLGLALTREILNITGITIRETGEPGKGARFEMTVPKGVYRLADTL